MGLILCKECKYQNTEDCAAKKTFDGIILTPESGCTNGKPKETKKQ